MEWNGTEWNGMEWNGMEWDGVEWNGVERNGTERNGTELNVGRDLLDRVHRLAERGDVELLEARARELARVVHAVEQRVDLQATHHATNAKAGGRAGGRAAAARRPEWCLSGAQKNEWEEALALLVVRVRRALRSVRRRAEVSVGPDAQR